MKLSVWLPCVAGSGAPNASANENAVGAPAWVGSETGSQFRPRLTVRKTFGEFCCELMSIAAGLYGLIAICDPEKSSVGDSKSRNVLKSPLHCPTLWPGLSLACGRLLPGPPVRLVVGRPGRSS